MSKHIENMFTRMDLGQIGSFLLHGVDRVETEHRPYHIRLKQGSDAIYKRLENLTPVEEHLNQAHGDLSQALGSYEAVYTEIGMKAGAKILYQLLLAEE